jgi:hypothetical protein
MLSSQLGQKAESLKDMNKRKLEMQAELERIKLQIKEINLKHKDKTIVEAPSFEEGSFNNSDKDVVSPGAEAMNASLNRTTTTAADG